jgi:hypothetical protein
VEFDLGKVDPLAEVAEPVHTGRGGLYSPTVEAPKDDDLLGDVGPAPDALPDLPETEPVAEAVAEPHPQAADVATTAPTPDLPSLPEDEALPEAATPAVTQPEPTPSAQDQRIWPWPKAEAWSPTQVYQEVVSAMEHIKHGRMEAAANTLDHLGPHLDDHLDMLLHVSVLMQHLGRQEHMKWTLDMAAYVHPTDPHVQQARSQLLV